MSAEISWPQINQPFAVLPTFKLYSCVNLKCKKGKTIAIFKKKTRKLLKEQFHVLTKGSNKFNCLIKEMLFIRKLKPSLNVQADSIRAKVFT